MVHDKRFCDFITKKMEQKVDVDSLQEERKNLREQLRQAEGSKKKLVEQMDKLDVTDRHYDRKYQDMQDRLDNLYDRIDEIEDAIADVPRKINGAYGEQITTEALYKILRDYDKMYSKMSDADKKLFFQNFIKSIEIDPAPTRKKRVLKHIDFRFPVSYDAEDNSFLLPTQNDVETVVLLSDKKVDGHINIDLDVEKLEDKSVASK